MKLLLLVFFQLFNVFLLLFNKLLFFLKLKLEVLKTPIKLLNLFLNVANIGLLILLMDLSFTALSFLKVIKTVARTLSAELLLNLEEMRLLRHRVSKQFLLRTAVRTLMNSLELFVKINAIFKDNRLVQPPLILQFLL